MRSWRWTVMYYLTQFPVGEPDPYDHDSPWDSPRNLQVARAYTPSFFLCPSDPTPTSAEHAHYAMIVGADAATHPGKWTRLADLGAPASTILVAEIAESDILCAEPRDLEFDKMSFRINDPNQPSISSHHPGGALTIYADASVHFLSNDTDPAVVRALCTRDASDNP